MTFEPLRPPPPRAPYFDTGRGAWVLSRYADVVAAFAEPNLWATSTEGEDQSASRDARGVLLARGAIQDALSPQRLTRWQAEIEALAGRILEGLPDERAVDLLHEFAMPLCLDLAMRITGADRADQFRLAALAAQVFARVGAADGSAARTAADAATAELERMLAGADIPKGEPAFVGVSQALPRLLASGWAALLRWPEEIARLRLDRELMPGAVEELLRYAGIVPMVCRVARCDLELAGARIGQGERADLMLTSANRDPARFPDPDRLDVSRRPASQLALGIGRNSCVGLVVIRMVSAVATGALLERFASIHLAEEVPWSVGSGFSVPQAVRVDLRRDAD
jgi:cytochrome P450